MIWGDYDEETEQYVSVPVVIRPEDPYDTAYKQRTFRIWSSQYLNTTNLDFNNGTNNYHVQFDDDTKLDRVMASGDISAPTAEAGQSIVTLSSEAQKADFAVYFNGQELSTTPSDTYYEYSNLTVKLHSTQPGNYIAIIRQKPATGRVKYQDGTWYTLSGTTPTGLYSINEHGMVIGESGSTRFAGTNELLSGKLFVGPRPATTLGMRPSNTDEEEEEQ